jgi:C4-dicarboxylate-specific signal transduction histidine kinase
VEHDVRNPLANLKKHIATMRLSYQHNSEVQGDLPFLEEQCRRIEAATDLIPSVRAAPEYYAQHNKRWNIVEVMRSALKLAAAAMDAASAEVEVVEPKRALFVIAYRERLLQAFVNILNNAAEACVAAPAGRRARIEVRVRPSPDGREVVMSVRDNGVGVAPERIPYLTSPFVSTKAGVRENRGIGLFISSRIIEQAGGRLEFDSDGQSFTEVHVHLALAEDDGGAQAKGPERRAR